MEVITIESEAYKNLISKLNSIFEHINEYTNLDEIWVDGYEICTFLKISDKTLYRIRKSGELPYSVLSGKIYYTIGDIKRLLESKKMKTGNPIDKLIEEHRKHAKYRKANKLKKK